MSGIAGAIYPDVFQVYHFVEQMLDILDHTGKGPRDIYTHRNIQLGATGQKLATNEKKIVYCALDGSLANKSQLLKELRSQGTEIEEHEDDRALILAAYEIWGTSFPDHLDGNFIIALFDQNEERLLLIRDRIGVKSLYWYHHNNLFLFSTELKGLLATEAVPQTIAMDAVSSYLYFGYIPQDMTPIQGVNKLLPGYVLNFSLRKNMQVESYWSLSAFFQSTHREKPQILLQHLDHLINSSVRKRLPKEGKIGCLLSGGLGSAAAALYVEKNASKNKVEAYTAGFTGYNDPDISAAKDAASSLTMPHQIMAINSNQCIENLPKIIWYLDEPIADVNVVSAWYLGELASKHTKTVFSGMGSDEFLAGHSRYSTAEQKLGPLKNLFQHIFRHSKYLTLPLLKLVWEPLAFRYLKAVRTDPWQIAYMQRNALFDLNLLHDAAPHLKDLFDLEAFIQRFHHLNRVPTKVGALLYLDIKTRLADCYSFQYEKMLSAHGLHWETPFLDRDLIEFLAGLPEPDALVELQTASLLKELLKNNFTPQFLNRPKRTRLNFLGTWASFPPIMELFQRLPHGDLVDTGLVSADWIRKRIKEVPTSKVVFRYLWALLTLELWIQIFINRPISRTPPTQPAIELLRH